MRAEEYIESLAATGRNTFTTTAAIEAIGGSDDAVRAQLRRLKKKGHIASPMRSFHVLVPPMYRRQGCTPAEHFIDQMMEYIGEPYYVALLSAAERHGAAHQRPQTLQVMVPKNRAPIVCGTVRIHFVARGDLAGLPVNTFNTPHGYIKYATPELTALELVGYPQYVGGLNNVVTVLDELHQEMDPTSVAEVACLCPIGWSQRLGYLLELVDAPKTLTGMLESLVSKKAHSYIPLRRSEDVAGASRDSKWKVIINVEIEADQ